MERGRERSRQRETEGKTQVEISRDRGKEGTVIERRDFEMEERQKGRIRGKKSKR
jgi:hypothetical protein